MSIMKAPEFSQRSALIAGGTDGLNLGIAQHLASLGMAVAVLGRDPEKAERAAQSLLDAGARQAIGLSADVRDPEAIGAAFSRASTAFGPLDIVIAGAAGNFPAPAIDISPKGFKTVVDIDLLGAYNTFRTAFDHLRPGGGSLIAITAPQAVNPTAFQAHVCAAKAGINMLVKCLALEWGPAGIRVNAVSPGPVNDTEGMARLAPTEAARAAINGRLALRRWADKREVAELVAFLCSDAASYLTGGIYNCDGGHELGDASADCLTSRRVVAAG